MSDLCAELDAYKYRKILYGQGITVFIAVVNKIIEVITVTLFDWISYDTHSVLSANITVTVFLAQFFNTAVLILLENANWKDVAPEWLTDGGFG